MEKLLDGEDIKYHEMYYFISDKDGKKIPIGERNNISIDEIDKIKRRNIEKPLLYYRNKEEIILSEKELKSLTLSYTIFLKYTENIYCIDIDDECIKTLEELNIDILKGCPWLKGNTKGIHVYIKIDNMPKYTDQQDVYNEFKGDLIKKNNMWENKKKELYNYNEKIPVYDYEEIKHIFNYKINKPIIEIKCGKEKKVKECLEKKVIVKEYDDTVIKLIECLDIKRVDNFISWISTGRILNSIFNDKGYDYWEIISRKSIKKYKEDEWNYGLIKNKYYETFKDDKKDIEILYKMACKDNPKLFYYYFSDYYKSNDDNLYNQAFTSGMLSDYFKSIYGDIFLYTKDQLYYFNGVYWVKENKKNSYINNFIDSIFYNNLVQYSTNLISAYSNRDEIKTNKIIKFLGKIQDLRKNVFRKALIEDIMNKINNDEIKFDFKPNLFCFNNKLFDLNLNDWIEPKPEYYITLTTGYDYNDCFDKLKIEELEKLIETILPGEELRKFYLKCLSTGLYGQQQEHLFVCTGAGGNGKSLLNGLMLECVGNYGYKLQSCILNESIKSGANPQYNQLNNMRFCLVQEPEKNQKIKGSNVKEITGDDTINCRDLFSSKCQILLALSLFLEANGVPNIDIIDGGIKRRIRIIPFNSSFVDKDEYEKLKHLNNIYIKNTKYKSK